jgi:hypothetical protein
LADEQVRTYQQTLADRLWRWGKHHRGAVTGLVVLLLLTVVGLSVERWVMGIKQVRMEESLELALEGKKEAQTKLVQLDKEDGVYVTLHGSLKSLQLTRPWSVDGKTLGRSPERRLLATNIWARTGDYLASAPEAEALARAESLPGATLYELACIQALNAAHAARDGERPPPEREKRAERYASQAVTLLRRAAAGGFFREPAKVTEMDKESDLSFLRDREDYRRFRAGLR